MDIEAGGAVPSPGEHEVDFSVAQLVETSPEFRQWFVERATPHDAVSSYVGSTIHATYAGEGESDVEFGFVSESGSRHLVLVENKIDAAKQPQQFQRYYNRGRFRTERGDWDSFSVCLLAPEIYPDAEDREGVDAVVTYEEVIDILGSLDHDTADFCRSVFETALQRGNTVADASGALQEVAERVREQPGLEWLEPVQGQNKSLVFASTHPDHPAAVGYNVYVAEKGVGGKTKIRLKFWKANEVSEARMEALKSVLSDHAESLPDYDWMFDRKADVGAKTLWHDEMDGHWNDSSYPETVVDELEALVSTLHPAFVGKHFDDE